MTQNLRFSSVSVPLIHISSFLDEIHARFCSFSRLEILISLPLNQPNNFYVFATYILHDSTPSRQFRFIANSEFSNQNSLSSELYAIGADTSQQPNQFYTSMDVVTRVSICTMNFFYILFGLISDLYACCLVIVSHLNLMPTTSLIPDLCILYALSDHKI